MTAAQQHQATIANLLSHLDGSITCVCVQCGAIFTIRPGSERMFCETCQCEREENACCDAPAPRTIHATAAPDGSTFATVLCDSCGKRKEVEL